MSSVLIVTEIQKGQIREASYELASFARKLGGDAASVVIGSGVGAEAEAFAKKAGGTVYVIDDPALANYTAEAYAKAIRGAVDASGASTVLLSNTPTGWDVAPRVAAALDAAFVSDAFDFDGTAFVRRVFNGKLDAKVVANAPKTVVTVQPGAVAAIDGGAGGTTQALAVDVSGARTKFVATKVAEAKGVDLTKADIIVSGGRGVGAPEKFPEVIQPLADALGGAMGASRPVVDAGWLPHEYQVGSSGQVVTPKLYIACGISGAIQHLVGMKGSNYIIAINKDPDAPIFEVAQLGAVGDLFEIVPKLTEAVKTAKG
jgi:electron transfer flavoprotein alpha subunit